MASAAAAKVSSRRWTEQASWSSAAVRLAIAVAQGAWGRPGGSEPLRSAGKRP